MLALLLSLLFLLINAHKNDASEKMCTEDCLHLIHIPVTANFSLGLYLLVVLYVFYDTVFCQTIDQIPFNSFKNLQKDIK